jgi:hypothetical protein
MFHIALTRLPSELKRLGWPPIAPPWKNESERFWRLLEGPACARSPLGLASILAQCSGSAALFVAPSVVAVIRRRTKEAVGTPIQNDSGLPQGPLGASETS